MPDGGNVLTWRWTPLRYNAAQEAYSESTHRFNVVPAGRRSGKTEKAKRKVLICAMEAEMPWEPRYFCAAPTRDQAKRIYWDDLKALSPSWMVEDIWESELKIRYINGAEVHVLGLDVPARIEGSPWDGGILDEYGNMKAEAWDANVRPALSDRHGWCDLIGVPEGRNHYYEIAKFAQAQMKALGKKSEWGYFHWKSAEILSAKEIESAKASMDPLTFQQEYEGSFISFEGRVYYQFSDDTHTAPLRNMYNPRAPLDLCFDFNVDPGVCAITQEHKIGTLIIGEVHIPRNSNTPAVCRALLSKDGVPTIWAKHQGLVRCYGDATGGARGSAQTEGSDWDLIKKELSPTFKQRLEFRVKAKNPSERARINAVNSRLRTVAGSIHLFVDPVHAPHVVKDFEGVTYLKGGSGEIDKKIAPHLTHISDALGYKIEYEYPVVDKELKKLALGGY